tara:strand:+ start:278 stop:550 length:273 start_codon:yes stop_codon:yes gene_type:complete
MKVLGTLRYEKNGKESFSVRFDDGITLRIQKSRTGTWEKTSTISTGLSSYFITKSKWPKGKNLEKRIELAGALITKNIKNNRYRKNKKDL